MKPPYPSWYVRNLYPITPDQMDKAQRWAERCGSIEVYRGFVCIHLTNPLGYSIRKRFYRTKEGLLDALRYMAKISQDIYRELPDLS